MKLLLSTVILLSLMSATASTGHASMLEIRGDNYWPQLSSRLFEDIPQGHWSYSSLKKLIFISQLDKSRIPQLERSITRYEFAVLIWLCDGALNGTRRGAANDLLVALNYEYGLEIMDVASRPRSNASRSQQDKKALAEFDEMVKRNRNELTPDQWWDFLQQGFKVPVRTVTGTVVEGRCHFEVQLR